MGTYTTNYNLFMPTVGEQGWGTLVNSNFTTIDTTMGNLNTRLTAVESEVNGDLSCTSVTTSGTITSTGQITANGGIAGTMGTFSGTISAARLERTTDYTVTCTTPNASIGYPMSGTVCILPLRDKPYNGTIIVRKNTSEGATNLTYITSLGNSTGNSIAFSRTPNEVKTITLTNAECLYINLSQYVGIGHVTVT